MPIYLDTRGKAILSIGICARCSVKYAMSDLTPDPNAPGLLVCPDGCKDVLDPWRLPPRDGDRISIEYARPDIDISTPGAMPVYTNQIDGIGSILPTRPWAPRAPYVKGASTTPLNVDNPNVTLPQYQFLAIVAGNSGPIPPVWPVHAGVEVQDGTVTWLCLGIYPN